MDKMKIEKLLSKVAKFQCKYPIPLFIIFILFTSVLAVGLPNIRMQTDLTKELPQDTPTSVQQKKVNNELGGTGVILILVYLDKENVIENSVKDIREPRVIESIVKLQDLLEKDPQVKSVSSIASVFRTISVPETQEGIKFILEQVPETEQLFNHDYSVTLIYVSTSLGDSEEKIKGFMEKVQEDIDQLEKPPGVKFTVTGDVPIRSMLMDLLEEDMIFTMVIASVFILILLAVLLRSFTKAILVLSPLLFGIAWTFGTAGLIDMPISIATVAIGAMIIGLGVEYGVFMIKRYSEEKAKGNSVNQSLLVAVPSVGSAIFGSAVTTMVGFLALLMATVPMIQHLGILLALGIFYCLVAVLFFSPILILLEEKLSGKIKNKVFKDFGVKHA